VLQPLKEKGMLLSGDFRSSIPLILAWCWPFAGADACPPRGQHTKRYLFTFRLTVSVWVSPPDDGTPLPKTPVTVTV
jgi:hypothetical protein